MANETTNFNIGGIDHPVKDPNAYVKPSTGIPKSDLSQEVQDALDEAGSGDGTVTGVKVGSTTYEPTDGVVDLSTPFGGKVDKNGTDSLMTAAEHTKLQNLPTNEQLIQQFGSKANDADVVKSISVNGGTAQTPTQGNVNIVVEGAQGKSAYQSYYDTTSDNPKMTEAQWATAILRSAYRSYLATTSDNPVMTETQWVASLKGEKGDTGNVVFEDLEDLVALLVNDLTTGGAGNFLSAEMGKRLKDKINEVYGQLQTVYAKLAGIAFTDGKSPATLPDLDWSVPKHAVSFSISGNAVVLYKGIQYGNGDAAQVEEGDTASLVIAPASGFELSAAPTVTVGGVSATATSNGDGTYTVEVTMGASNIVVSITATVVTQTVSAVFKRITALSTYNGDSTVVPTMTIANDGTTGSSVSNIGTVDKGGNFNGVVSAGAGFSIFSVVVMMGSTDITKDVYDPATQAISIVGVTDDVTITVTVCSGSNGVLTDVSLHARSWSGQVGVASVFDPKLVNDEGWCATEEIVTIPASANKLKWIFGANCMPASDISATDSATWRRSCIYIDETFTPLSFISVGDMTHVSAGYREIPVMVNSGTVRATYIRASFKTSLLSTSKLQYSTNNGATWTDLWVGSQHIPSNS